MKVAILMAGPYRGNESIIQNQLNMVGSYDTFVSCFEHYKQDWINSGWPIKDIFTTPTVNFLQTNWSKYRNDEPGQSGFWQFWNLRNVINSIEDNYDWYIKSRCDLIFEYGHISEHIFTTLEKNTLYCPLNYFDDQSWDYATLINDQFYIADYNTMKAISEFVTEYYNVKRHECNDGMCSNERNLRKFLDERGVCIKILENIKYKKNHNGVTGPAGCSGFQLEKI